MSDAPVHRGRKVGSVNSPEHRAAISTGAAARRGFTDQDVITYVNAEHSIREAGKWFGLTTQRISQITIKHGTSRPRGVPIKRTVSP